MTTEESGLVGCCAVRLLNYFPTFRLQGYESIHVLITLMTKAALLFETSGSNYPPTLCTNPEDSFPQRENKFASN